MMKTLVLTTVCMLTITAHADDAAPHVSVTTDAMTLVGIVDLTVEAKLMPHVGASATLGAGALVFDTSIHAKLAGVGANYYLGDELAGWHVGTQAKYISVTADGGMSSSPLFGQGLGVAAYGGYKWMRPSGFTAYVQLGVAAGSVVISDRSGSIGGRMVGSMTNAGIGYSF